MHSPLQQSRLQSHPVLPPLFKHLKQLRWEKGEANNQKNPLIRAHFPFTVNQPVLNLALGSADEQTPMKVGVLFSGGQAPGGHNVIAGLYDALTSLHSDNQLIGFLDGPQGLIDQRWIPLTAESIAPYRNQGGFDMIGSGRTKIERPDQFQAVKACIDKLGLTGLVLIGGDDTNTSAALLAEFFASQHSPLCVIGVPKTIDGDLHNPWIEVPFGFDTACKVYAEMIGNIAKDAQSAKKYYFFIKLMGRSASHITLDCALQTQINYACIAEEAAAQEWTLEHVVRELADLICLRADCGKNYGVVLIPEGLIEFLVDLKQLVKELNRLSGQQDLTLVDLSTVLTEASWACYEKLPTSFRETLLYDRDAYGNVQLSKIETERLLISLVSQELLERKKEGTYAGSFNPQPLFYGYEGRSGLPSNFDCQYTYALGHTAALLVKGQANGYMATIHQLSKPVRDWEVRGIPLTMLLDIEERKGREVAVIKKGLVDLEGAKFSRYASRRADWKLEDAYRLPGPIQFEGPKDLTDCKSLIDN